jgi:cytochrome c oxidase cbb3-type subunit 3
MKLNFNINRFLKGGLLATAMLSMLPMISIAQEAAASDTPPIGKYQMMRYILTGTAVLLGLVIIVMALAVGSAGKMYWERTKKNSAKGKILPLLMFLLLSSGPVLAQDAATDAATTPTGFTVPYDIYIYFVVVGLEMLVILALSRMLLKFLAPEKPAAAKTQKTFSFKEIFKKVNETVDVEEEDQLDLKHDYDGIRELDNKVPKWWQYAFYCTILFGVVYLYRMFVSGTLPDQIQELDAANKIAAIQKEAYLKNAANNVDENTVTMVDASGISAGASLYAKNCLACHGDQGQGGVGPNLTDEYWMHKGGLKDIFYSIKYGWPEKGMKAWKDDFSPAQIAQIASYIVTLKGTNPPGAKEAQGDLYVAPVEESHQSDEAKELNAAPSESDNNESKATL